MTDATPPRGRQQADKDPLTPATEEHPTATLICENNACRYFQVERTVRWAHLGQGLYLTGTIRCLCGRSPVFKPRVAGR